MNRLQRHTLCWLDPSALKFIDAQLDCVFNTLPAPLREAARNCLLSEALPGIVRRGMRDNISIPLGFCFPLRWRGQRLRLETTVSLQAVTQISTPEEIACLPIFGRTHAMCAFQALRQAWCGPEKHLGVWGSVALEMITPWLWTDNSSDLDVRITPAHGMMLSQCYALIAELEQHYSVRIDGEIVLVNGFSINIKEWFSGSPTLLAKGESDVKLITRDYAAELIKASIY